MSYKRGKPLFVMAIDFTKAVYSINRATLLKALMWHGCDSYLIDVVTELYTRDCTDIFKGELNVRQMEVSNFIRARMHGITSTICYDSKYDYKGYTGEHTRI